MGYGVEVERQVLVFLWLQVVQQRVSGRANSSLVPYFKQIVPSCVALK